MKHLTPQILLVLWSLLGLALRFARLTALPPWTDECATIAFSLGNSFLDVPLDRAIPPDILMQPLQPRPDATVADVVNHLMSESTHPPLYFILAHYWMRWFGGDNVLLAARSLSAILGTLAVPAIYALAFRTYRSVIVAQLAAVVMAVSPFGVFLAREARHYTLAVLVAIASLYCFVVAVEAIFQHKPLSPKVSIPWILINGFGIAVHYFFGLVPLSQALVLVGIWLTHTSHRRSLAWRGIAIAALGTTLSGVAWIPVWREVSQSNLTDWVYDGGIGIDALLRAIAWLLSMLLMFPLDILTLPLWIIIPSSLAFLVSLIWISKLLWKPSPPLPLSP
ncbi:glycosyltransferase family 39 protein, partial [Geitlerinema sp. CS-897]|nr:glycosyltransferase family 39 protein [Geitlerinema sp. CS-897]